MFAKLLSGWGLMALNVVIHAIGLTLGGIPAVLIAVWLVKSLPLDVVRWGVIVVVLYTATTLMRSAAEDRRGAPPVEPEVAAI